MLGSAGLCAGTTKPQPYGLFGGAVQGRFRVLDHRSYTVLSEQRLSSYLDASEHIVKYTAV